MPGSFHQPPPSATNKPTVSCRQGAIALRYTTLYIALIAMMWWTAQRKHASLGSHVRLRLAKWAVPR